jgi:hypothetical protein
VTDSGLGATHSSITPLEIRPSAGRADTLFVVGGGESLERNIIRFRLLYSGQLLGASKGDTRSAHKHEIRKHFSPQLKRLWENKDALRYWLLSAGSRARTAKGEPAGYSSDEMELSRIAGIEAVANSWTIQNSRFIPLITADVVARCRIDILFLRPEDQNYIIQGGDLDNRLKTLFDAFRMPKANEECGNDPEPCFVLLEDDSLISEVAIIADNLLMLPNQSELKINDAFLVIDVQVKSGEAKFNENQWTLESKKFKRSKPGTAP